MYIEWSISKQRLLRFFFIVNYRMLSLVTGQWDKEQVSQIVINFIIHS